MTIEQRMDKLERQNKWMRRTGAVAVALVAAVFLMGQGKEKPRVVEAGKFVLVNADGEVRAVLESINEHLAPAQLTLFDNKGVKRVVLSAGTGGASGLRLFGKKGVRAGLGVGGDASVADLALSDKDNNLRVQLYSWLDGSPGLVFRDRDKRVRARFHLEEDPAIELLGKSGKVVWKAPKD